MAQEANGQVSNHIKIKLCGLKRPCDIEAANKLKPDYIGFIFWAKSKRNISQETAAELKALLSPEIKAVGVFVDEEIEVVSSLLQHGIIDVAQLHGSESDSYIQTLREETGKPIFKAIKVRSKEDVLKAEVSIADEILLDAGYGTGTSFDWSLLEGIRRPYILAGGLSSENVEEAIIKLHPYGVDVSSGIETDGLKDTEKMHNFVQTVRKVELS